MVPYKFMQLMILVGIFYIVSLLIPQTVDFVRCFIFCNTLPRGNFAGSYFLKTRICCFIPHIYVILPASLYRVMSNLTTTVKILSLLLITSPLHAKPPEASAILILSPLASLVDSSTWVNRTLPATFIKRLTHSPSSKLLWPIKVLCLLYSTYECAGIMQPQATEI